MWIRIFACSFCFLLTAISGALANSCFQSTITNPTPFMGNNDEIFRLADGSLWEVKYEYSYLYEYYPSVTICPSEGKLIVANHVLNVVPLSNNSPNNPRPRSTNDILVVAFNSGCRDYFLADGPQGYYLLEWYGGYEPTVGDSMVGNLAAYGFQDVFYPEHNEQGRVYVDDYLLSKSTALEKYAEHCR